MIKKISGPDDICKCGHVKNFHIYLAKAPKHGELVIVVAECCKCDCLKYEASK